TCAQRTARSSISGRTSRRSSPCRRADRTGVWWAQPGVWMTSEGSNRPQSMKRTGWVVAAVGVWLLAAGAIAKVVTARRTTQAGAAYRFAVELPDSVVVANNVG